MNVIKKIIGLIVVKNAQTFECSMSAFLQMQVSIATVKKMETTSIQTRYASLKSVLKFFSTKETAIKMPSAKALKAAGDDGKLLSLALLKFIADAQTGKEYIVKPTFSFGRVLLKFSKNASKFAVNELVIYITEYEYQEQKRVQIVVAPPSNNDELEEFNDDLDELEELMSRKPASAAVTNDDDDDSDSDDDDNNEEPEPEPEKPAKKSKNR